MEVAGAILAAGFSTRFPEDKLSQPILGRPILAWSLEAIKHLGYKAVVLRPNDRKKNIIPHDYTILVNSRAELGLSSSIRVAASWMPAGVDGLLLILGDQPLSGLVTSNLVDEFKKGGCVGVSAIHNGEPVSPAIFSRQIIHELLLLEGDVGAKSVILRHRPSFRFVEAPEDAIIDCDTPESLKTIARALTLIHRL